MGYIGKIPSAVPLTSADITDNVITSAKIVDGTIALADLSATGTKDATTFLRGDNTFATAGATAGQVIQVVTDTDQTERATTSSTFTDVTGLSVSITPSSTSNKIFVIATGGGGVDGSGLAYYTILRDSTNLGNGTSGMQVVRGNSGSVYAGATISVLDSPSTTSAITYKVQFRSTSGTTNAFWGYDGGKTSITAMEIKG